MKFKKLGLGILGLFAVVNCYGGKIEPEKKDGVVELFNAERHKVKSIFHRCAPWVKGDLTPVLKNVEFQNEKFMKFSYKGSKGMAQANFVTSPQTLKKMLPDNTVYDGIKITICYPEKELLKVGISLGFEDKTILATSIMLKPGCHEYLVNTGFRRAKFPPKWSLLKRVGFIQKSSEPVRNSFLLKKVVMSVKKVKLQKKTLKITYKKKVAEILESEKPLLVNGKIVPTAWRQASPISGFTRNSKSCSLLKAKIGCDGKSLYVGTRADFKNAPVGNVKPGGEMEKLWSDELLEYFFSGENDNQKKIQFVSNINGVVWDSVVEFDVVAAAVIRKANNWSLEHKKNLSYQNNTWTTDTVFPLSGIKVDLKKERFMGFQLIQNYANSPSIIWSPSKKFPNAKKFGVLVFNKKAFGKGCIEIKSLESSGIRNASSMDLGLELESRNLAPDKYKYSVKVVHSDATCVVDSGVIEITEKTQKHKLKISNLKNLNGVYSIYFSIYNKNNDIKLAAVNFENAKDFLNLFGKKVFSVTPKKVKWGKGNFSVNAHEKLYVGGNPTPRTLKTAKIFAGKLYGYSGRKYKIIKSFGNDGINLKIEPFKKEGYKLDIAPENVIIRGADEAGLYYGTVTFLQILRMPMEIKDSTPVQCAEIVDWPDKGMRILSLLHPWNFPANATREDRGMNYMINWLERYVAGNKLNAAIIDLSSLIKYERHPELNKKQTLYSLEDIGKLAQFCRDNFIEFIPRWQTGGHSNWWLTVIHPELREKGSKAQADVTHPYYSKIVFNCIKDVLDVSGAKYINAGMDEWWHGWKKDETPDKLLNGKIRAEALRDWVIQLNNFCRKNNVKVIMEGDMLFPAHNGTRFDCYKEIDRIPKDIIITNWGKLDEATRYFHDRGFKTIVTATGECYPDKTLKLLSGLGPNCYGFTSFNINKLNYPTVLTRYADFAWNCNSDKKGKSRDCMSSGTLIAAMENLSVMPNPYASEKIDSLDLDKLLDRSLDAELKKNNRKIFGSAEKVFEEVPAGEQLIANIPTQFGNNDENCIVLDKSRSKVISVSRKCSSLIFLHTVIGDMVKVQNWHWRNWYYGFPVGDYQITYSDDSKVKIPLRLCDNIFFASCSPLIAAPIGCRYVMGMKNVNGGYNFLYQYEWINPYPKKQIKEIEYIHDGVYDFKIALLAVSARKIKLRN